MSATPYRDDRDPLKAEETSLSNELAALRKRERGVVHALDETRTKLRAARRPLPLLDDVKVASPCSASWDDMVGDDRVRFCGKCAKNVYDLSSMTREDAEALLARKDGDPGGAKLCIRFYRRADGTIMTTDCPVGVRRKRGRRVRDGRHGRERRDRRHGPGRGARAHDGRGADVGGGHGRSA